jgi:SAM-dependent methyltransferase
MVDWQHWQRSWDAQQEGYLPDREERFARMLDVVEAHCGEKPRVLDLAGGTGSITIRLLERLAGASSVVLDIDPSLLRIARGTLGADHRVTIVRTDLAEATWRDQLSGEPFDAVLTATALHWLTEERLAALYAEIQAALRPGGVFMNADHMVDPGLPELTERFTRWREAIREEAVERGTVTAWADWWEQARSAPELADAVAERETIFSFPHSGGSMPPYARHEELLYAAGFTEVGLIWRGLHDATVAAVR